jgi:hypothetical protein
MANLSRPVYWRGHQWAVTGHGVECIHSYYPIQGSRVWEHGSPFKVDHPGWLAHMAEKNWVDLHDFCDAFDYAIFNYKWLVRKHPRNWQSNENAMSESRAMMVKYGGLAKFIYSQSTRDQEGRLRTIPAPAPTEGIDWDAFADRHNARRKARAC